MFKKIKVQLPVLKFIVKVNTFDLMVITNWCFRDTQGIWLRAGT